MDYETTQKLQKEISSGETLLWSGRPRQGPILREFDAIAIPFSLLWGGSAIFWEYRVYTTDAPPFALLFGLLFGGVFVVIGLYLIFGRFIADAMKRKGTYYGVTNDRILILSEFPVRKVNSLNLRTLSDITFSNKSDGSGSITFGPQHPMAGTSWPGMGQDQSPMFEFIKNARTVYKTIRDAQKEST